MSAPEDEGVSVPRDVTAEAKVLGACLWSPDAYRQARLIVTEGDFWRADHALVWRHIGFCMTDYGVADPVLVLDSLRAAGVKQLADLTPYLHTLYSQAPVGMECIPHAQIIADLAVRRRVLQAGQRMVQRASSGVGDVAELLESAATDIRSARDARAGVELLTVPISEFMAAELDPPDWVVPGLLARRDRFILTGPGGLGKSTLLRQIAVCAAAGIAPLDWHYGEMFEPVRVSLIDCENSDDQLKTELWPLLKLARDVDRPVEDRLMIGGHGQPLDLLDPANVLSIMRTIDHDKPDLVYIGPVYKLHNGDPDKELHVKQVTAALDQIRSTGAAIICEAHPTKEGQRGFTSLAPSGANLWTWWPEFGRGLRPDPDADPILRRCALESWRIDRVHRNWPKWIEAGGGGWPWARAQ